MSMLIRKSLRTAWRYRTQFLSMLIMITLGVGIFLGFNIEWKSIETDTSAFFEQTRYADYRLYAELGFSEGDIAAIRDIEGVEAASRYFAVNVDLDGRTQSLSLNISEDGAVSIPLVLEGTEYDPAADGLWISDRFAEANGLALGDELTLVYSGIKLRGEIVGLVKSGEMMICVADENQLMPDFTSFGYAFATPQALKKALGFAFYPQIHLRSQLSKDALEEAVADALGRTTLVLSKNEHIAYAGAASEAEEGKVMGSVLPVLFLAIAILTMVTTMHRLAVNEKIQIGTLKALGFHDRKILRHYTFYGLAIGLAGSLLGVALGYGIAALIMSPNGMMSTYFDLPAWPLVMPGFCPPVLAAIVLLLTLIGRLSIRRMLRGTASEALRPYAPKAMKRSVLENLPLWKRLPFGTRWNLRDVLRHKSRSAMTLVGVIGCMLLLVGAFGMKDTMNEFLWVFDSVISNYATRVNLAESAQNSEALALAEQLDGDWLATSAVSCEGRTLSMDIYGLEHGMIRFVDADIHPIELTDDGVYLCQRLKGIAEIGDTITVSPYGSESQYSVRVAGYFRSVLSESIAMTSAYAESAGLPYRLTSVFTNSPIEEVRASTLITDKQEKRAIMDSYESFLEIMNLMVLLLAAAAVILGIVVLYNLGTMSYLERRRELATLKVLGFRDRHIGRLLIGQNIWLTVIGVLIGLPGGVATLRVLIAKLGTEYELKVVVGPQTLAVSTLLTFGTSLLVGWAVARKSRRIDMVEALKGAE